MIDKLKEQTKIIRGGLDRSKFQETSEPIFLTSGFVYNKAEDAEAMFNEEIEGYQYTRYSNPTITAFEKRLAIIDGAEECFATATGMAAVYASIMCQLKSGDHVVSARSLFGSCRQILKKIITNYGIEVTFVDGKNNDEWQNAIRKNTKVFFYETPSNPCLEIINIKEVSKIAKQNNITTVVDNVFASPSLQKPSKLGADVVVYSGTKHIDGQGRVMGGAILSSKKFKEEKLKFFLRNIGSSISPFNAWILLKGLETINLRVNAQSDNAFMIAQFLENHQQIEKVFYPYLKSFEQFDLAKQQQTKGGTVISFKIKGAKTEAYNLMNKLKIFTISNNLGDTKSLSIHPSTTTHRILEPKEKLEQNISDNLIRLSIGLEDPKDLIQDLDSSIQ